MPWLYLFIAAACEMIWPIGFKYTNGFTNISKNGPLITLVFAVMGVSLWLMTLASRGGIPVGTAYAVWTGLGATGTAILGMVLFNEPRDLARLACLSLVIIGVIGLKFLSPPDAPATAPKEQAAITSTEKPGA